MTPEQQQHVEASNIRKKVLTMRQKGLEPFFEEIRTAVDDLKIPTDKFAPISADLDNALDLIAKHHDVDLSVARLSGMYRYLMEKNEYHADPEQFYQLIHLGLLKPGDQLVDLGTGPGATVSLWHEQGNPAIGVDASPSFVARKSHLLKLGLIDADLNYLQTLIGTLAERRTIFTSLTLDRVGDPRQLLRNIVDLAGENGNIGVASLFPIVPIDDEDVDDPIVYTPEQHRIASTGTEDGDLRQVREYLEDISKRKINVSKAPSHVHTSSGAQAYDRYHFLTSDPK